jgi:hypothetical protein
LDLPHGGIPVAHDQATSGSVTRGAMRLEVVFDFRFERGLQQLPRASAQRLLEFRLADNRCETEVFVVGFLRRVLDGHFGSV